MAKGISRILKRKAPRVRLTVMVPEETIVALHALQKERPTLYANQIIHDAVMFAQVNSMYDPAFLFDAAGKRRVDPVRAVKLTKAQLCERYGATVEGNTVAFVRYEEVPIGIMKNKVSLPLSALPDDEDGIRKIMIGNFKSVEEAEARYQEDQETKSNESGS